MNKEEIKEEIKELNSILKGVSRAVLSVLILISFSFFATYLSEYLSSNNYFGDYTEVSNRLGKEYYQRCWGARHHWYFCSCVIMFIFSLFRIGLYSRLVYLNNINDKN
jgi:ABC-type Fe3+ transport system permease subunit